MFARPQLLMLLAAAALAAGCADSQTTPDSAKVTCKAGQEVNFDQKTGKGYCVDVDSGTLGGDTGSVGQDAGSTADTASGGDAGSGGKDSASSGDSASGGDDAAVNACKPTLPTADKWWVCPPSPVNAGGKLHGQSCTQDSDCLYGMCMFGLPLAAYDKTIGICSKNCGYQGSKDAICASEEGNPVASDTYYCTIEKTIQSGNTLRDTSKPGPFKMCGHGCKTDDDCKAWNPDLPTCTKVSTPALSTNPNGVCIRLPK